MKRNLRAAANRCVLALTKLPAFARWASSQGYTKADTKGEFEVLRLKPKTGPVLIWFTRAGAFHATSAGRESRLVQRWLRERGGKDGKLIADMAEFREAQP